jgi:hypothetical protein
MKAAISKIQDQSARKFHELSEAAKLLPKWLSRVRATAWHKSYKVEFAIQGIILRRRNWITWLLIVGIFLGSWFLSYRLQAALALAFLEKARFETLKSLIMTVGASLVGATAIAFSFVMFAMQVNVERMPHGLFRKFTGDLRLMTAFASTFGIAIAVPSLALVPDNEWASLAICYSVLGTFLVFVLLIYSYRRALALINPLRQLHFVVDDASRSFKVWGRRATRAAPLLEQDASPEPSPHGPTHDMSRTAYFRVNPHWTEGAFRSLRYAVAFSRRYAETGDYEVSAAALNAILMLSASYINVKGKTFYSDNALFEHPFSSDAYVNETLEALRQNAQIAVSRGDEQQIEQTFRAFAGLVQLYAAIDYSNHSALPKHAQLAATYLAEATQAVLPHNLADVAMQGVRLLGEAAIAILAATTNPTQIASIVRRIGVLGSTGTLNEKYRALTVEAITRLARLTMAILRTKSKDSRFAFKEIDDTISMIARLFLTVPDVGMNTHTTYLGPYFSGTSFDTFLKSLTDFSNSVLVAPADSDDAKVAISNLASWSENLHKNAKELLVIAISNNSHFAFDMIHWISHTSKLLIAVTAAPACKDQLRDKILEHAWWLIAALAAIPDTKEATYLGENYKVSEELFDTGLEALHRGLLEQRPELVAKIMLLLLDWGLRETTYVTGYAVLETSIFGCATLALAGDLGTVLKEKLLEKLDRVPERNQAHLNRTARNIRRRAKSLRTNPFSLSRIEQAMESAPRATIVPFLTELADILSPSTATEEVKPDFL